MRTFLLIVPSVWISAGLYMWGMVMERDASLPSEPIYKHVAVENVHQHMAGALRSQGMIPQ